MKNLAVLWAESLPSAEIRGLFTYFTKVEGCAGLLRYFGAFLFWHIFALLTGDILTLLTRLLTTFLFGNFLALLTGNLFAFLLGNILAALSGYLTTFLPKKQKKLTL